MDAAFEQAVRSRAYEIWESEGRPENCSLAHWDRAMQEVASLVLAKAPPTKVKVKAARVAAAGIREAKGRRASIQPALN